MSERVAIEGCPREAKATSRRAPVRRRMQPDWLALSTWIVAFTSTSARETSFRPPVAIADRQTLVMCDQLATVDLNRLTEPVGFLTIKEMQRVDEALALVLDL
jgi:mRNA interferase MazF